MIVKSAIQLSLGVLLFSSIAQAKIYPCSGAPGAYRTNPDNSVGGFVASTATVDATISIAPEESICERATVIEGAQLIDRAKISGKATIRCSV